MKHSWKWINCCQKLKIGSIQSEKWISPKRGTGETNMLLLLDSCASHPTMNDAKTFLSLFNCNLDIHRAAGASLVRFFAPSSVSSCLCVEFERVHESHFSYRIWPGDCVWQHIDPMCRKILCDQFAVVSALMPTFKREREGTFICLRFAYNAYWTRHWRDWRHTCLSVVFTWPSAVAQADDRARTHPLFFRPCIFFVVV